MFKTIAAALATTALMLSTADAAPKSKDHARLTVGHVGAAAPRRTYAWDVALPSVSASSQDEWANRSVFYRGPTYIGRY